jgi:hypothetical protein
MFHVKRGAKYRSPTAKSAIAGSKPPMGYSGDDAAQPFSCRREDVRFARGTSPSVED